MFGACCFLGLIATLLTGARTREPQRSVGPDRSPSALAVSPDGRLCVTANSTSDSVTLVDLTTGTLVAEHTCGRSPSDVAWVDEQTVLVSLLEDDSVALLRIGANRIRTEALIRVGDEPRAVAVVAPARRGFVALTGSDQLAVLDLAEPRVVDRVATGAQPRSLAVAPNNRWLVVACSDGGEAYVYDAATFQLISRRALLDKTGNLGVPAVLPDSSTCIIPHIVNRTFPIGAENIEKGWVIDNRLAKLPLPAGPYWDQTQLALDTRGDAVGDANAVAVSRDAKWLVVTCGGTHELLIFRQPEIPWPPADPGDFIPDELLQRDGRFRRLELGGRPLAVAFIDERTVVVANYLLNALQIVDVANARLVRTIHLGQTNPATLARRGEAIFYDADRSLNSWFSCHTCHFGGHTSGLTFDTLNDGSYSTQKLTPSLRGVAHTAPWTWHGWQTDLHAAMHKSLSSTMQTRTPPTHGDSEALVAFLGTLEHPVNPNRGPDGQLTKLAEQGKVLFSRKAGCATCHTGDHFTSRGTYDVGLGSSRDVYPKYNPPALRGLHSRRRFLHDGRASSLEEVLGKYHRPQDVAGEPLSDEELQALVEYLKSL